MPQHANVVFVVGDRFHEFKRGKDNIILVSEYWDRIAKNAISPQTPFFVAGQGLSESEGVVFERSLSEANREFLRQSNLGLRPKSKLTHKRKAENIMVSTPERHDEVNFSAQLLIDDDLAEMTDHCTGQHLQGMVLMESARQMFIAVTETHFAEVFPSPSAYFVINDFDTKFLSFAFPLPLTIRYKITDRGARPGRFVSFAAKMELVQCGRAVCQVQVAFSVHDKIVLGEKEQQKAQDSVTEKIAELRQSYRDRQEVDSNVG